jgi:hypothetical protein
VGIDCNSSCVFSGHYSHVGFSPGCEDGGMMNNMFGNFNFPSSEHLSTALECCFPKSDSSKCREFSERFKSLPVDVNPYFKVAYDQFAQCYNGNKSETAPIENNESNEKESFCNTCFLEDKCYPIGYRKSGKYCSDTGQFVAQLESEKSCDNNFECSSNVCVNSNCVSGSFIQRIIEWFKKFFGAE